MNIRNAADRAKLEAAGFTWVTVVTRGECKGKINSRHRSYDAANRAAKGKDLTVLEVWGSDTF